MSILHLTLVFMLVAAVISLVAERFRLPYTIALVIAGLAAGTLHVFPPVSITPEVLLTLLIPPLLFEGALYLPPADLRAYGWLIGLLAVPGTLIAAVAIGGAAEAVFRLPPRTAFLLGAIAAAIDPVSVIALVREMCLDTRLGAILEGEAVLNDGVAIVLFTIVTGAGGAGLSDAVERFFWLVGVGGAVGVALGGAVCYALDRIHLPLVEALSSLILLVGSLVLADALGASGVIAAMCAGVVLGSYGRSRLTEVGRETVRTLWDVIAFLANSVLFLFIGLQVPGRLLLRYWPLIAVVIVAAVAVRALTVSGFSAICQNAGVSIPTAWRRLLVWGGLRGGVAVALVLDLPATVPGRDAISAAVFGLVLFTLLGQGLTVRAVMRRAGLLPQSA